VLLLFLAQLLRVEGVLKRYWNADKFAFNKAMHGDGDEMLDDKLLDKTPCATTYPTLRSTKSFRLTLLGITVASLANSRLSKQQCYKAAQVLRISLIIMSGLPMALRITELLKNTFVWCYAEMLLNLHEVLEYASSWAEGCWCHDEDISIRLHHEDQRFLFCHKCNYRRFISVAGANGDGAKQLY
jgi:hypothetical protein